MGTLVLLRHGQSDWNQKNVFTGWVDVPLSRKGIEEADHAGELLKDKKFDAVYVSEQIRAIQTALLALTHNTDKKTPVIQHEEGKMAQWSVIYDEASRQETIPVIKNWHLNERYYGELQGKNKQRTAEQYGKEQVHQWRRSYDVPPPNGEALKHTAERAIPFFTDTIIPELEDGKNILISAHGNSLRAIVMHIDHLSQEEVLHLEIPTGIPIEYAYSENGLEKIN
jgi:2,3-bisphosphoglycerate-dependent phosphoglycerate mutase